MSKSQLTAYKGKFEKYDLVILDELGYVKITYDRAEICDKVMYRYGIYDGLTIAIEGLKQFDVNEFLEENKDSYLKNS